MLNVHSLVKDDWIAPSGKTMELHDAYSGEIIGKIGHGGLPFEEMISYGKINGGQALFKMSFHERAKMIKAVALYLMAHKAPLYELSYHTGATKPDSMIDIDGGIQTMLVFASKGRREMPDGQIYIDGDVEELSRDGSFKGLHIATPLSGVAVHINAFNFPVWGMLEKLAPAWLAGMPVIVKPASQTAYLTAAVLHLIQKSKLVPRGAVQMIAGSAGDLLGHLGAHDVVSFTGSATTANLLKSNPNIIENSVRFMAEQDSLNATVLGNDLARNAAGLAVFLREVVQEMTTKAGQKCTAIRRILVPHTQIDNVASLLAEKLGKIETGDPRLECIHMGPLVSTAHCQDVLKKARQIEHEARLVYGDLSESDSKREAIFTPVLFQCDQPDTAELVHMTEAFGPVSTLIPYQDTDHAIELLNMGGGSLVASVITDSGDFARAIAFHSAAWHGRLYFNNQKSAKASTGHGSPLPHLVHGGPGRAGGGEEMGGVRGVLHYMQRTAIQGHPDILSAISGNFISGSTPQKSDQHPFQQSFHELSIGQTITTGKREISLDDIEHFAAFTGDKFYAHMDEEAAKANPFFPGRVAHGYLLLSFAAGLFVEPSPGPVLANTGLNGLKFMKPVVAGDAIYVKLSVKRKTRRNDEYGEVRWHVEINNQNDERVAEYELLTMNAYESPTSAGGE